VARHYAENAETARDLVQETVLRAWSAYNPAEDRSYREGWLFVIQRRVASEWARSIQRRIVLEPIEHDELTELVLNGVIGNKEEIRGYGLFDETIRFSKANGIGGMIPEERRE
jgi:DNA-directed RNA polymerase specialized sigma24 family protein